MNIYSIKIFIKSPFRTEIKADTLWGHICWLIREKEGEEKLVDFLALYKQNSPPFLLSDAFPNNKLPAPIMPFPHEKIITYWNQKYPEFKMYQKNIEVKKAFLNLLGDIKKIRKSKFIDFEKLHKLKDSFSPLNFYLSEIEVMQNTKIQKSSGKNQNKNGNESEELKPQIEIETRTAINRFTFTAAEGKLFVNKAYFYPQNDKKNDPIPNFWMLIFIPQNSPYNIENISQLIKEVGELGYGADRSIGRGVFDISKPEPIKWQVENPNSYIALSNFCPAEDDPISAYYDVNIKYGKVGNIFSSTLREDIEFTPFKKPFIMLSAGSLIKSTNFNKNFCGRIIENIHRYPEVLQYAFTPILPLKTNE